MSSDRQHDPKKLRAIFTNLVRTFSGAALDSSANTKFFGGNHSIKATSKIIMHCLSIAHLFDEIFSTVAMTPTARNCKTSTAVYRSSTTATIHDCKHPKHLTAPLDFKDDGIIRIAKLNRRN